MTSSFYKQKLRKLRRSYALTQGDLARLAGLSSADYIAKIERGNRSPSLPTATRLIFLFDLPICSIFPELADKAVESLLDILFEMRDRIYEKKDKRSLRKVEFFDAAIGKLSLREFQNDKSL